MSATELKREIKKAVDRLTPKQLESLADYVHFLSRPSLTQRVQEAEEQIAAGRGRNWRKVREDV